MRAAALPVLLALTLGLATPVLADDAVAATYKTKCATCHGEDGRGGEKKAAMLKVEPAVLDFTRGEAAKLTTADLRKVIADGKNKMPAYSAKLSPAEIDALVAHVETLRKAAK
jgi:mono/diheme cytochrome c family protein